MKSEKNKDPISIFKKGDIFTKLSFIIFGLSNIVRGQVVKVIIFLAVEIAYIAYMIQTGVNNLVKMTTLGTQQQAMVFNEATGIFDVVQADNSMLILLWGVVTGVITVVFACVWLIQLYSGEQARQIHLSGRKAPGIIEDAKSLTNDNIHKFLLAIPVVGLLVFTVMPLVYMILMAFTNYDASHQPPGNLFTWVGL